MKFAPSAASMHDPALKKVFTFDERSIVSSSIRSYPHRRSATVYQFSGRGEKMVQRPVRMACPPVRNLCGCLDGKRSVRRIAAPVARFIRARLQVVKHRRNICVMRLFSWLGPDRAQHRAIDVQARRPAPRIGFEMRDATPAFHELAPFGATDAVRCDRARIGHRCLRRGRGRSRNRRVAPGVACLASSGRPLAAVGRSMTDARSASRRERAALWPKCRANVTPRPRFQVRRWHSRMADRPQPGLAPPIRGDRQDNFMTRHNCVVSRQPRL